MKTQAQPWAIVAWQEQKLPGKLNDTETRLYHPKNKALCLSLGSDTTIIKRFANKAEMQGHK
jgi:hypothetical protein